MLRHYWPAEVEACTRGPLPMLDEIIQGSRLDCSYTIIRVVDGCEAGPSAAPPRRVSMAKVTRGIYHDHEYVEIFCLELTSVEYLRNAYLLIAEDKQVFTSIDASIFQTK
ncbi:hypothetical protein EVAR_33027_1 [Eumeta japonica]|uniref:Uncharacterized protein n=1 Tax=Eumeta variegata TaxID=151549 RepID=A0A4C1VSW8_EUMVA|nr:hypothetical protein EVAR_33027_1 [Eumeta japonica]